jgi:hypothetical protein
VATNLVVVIFFKRFSGHFEPPNLARSINFRNQALTLFYPEENVFPDGRKVTNNAPVPHFDIADDLLGTVRGFLRTSSYGQFFCSR